MAFSIFFLLAGLAFIPRLGIQNDEALFAHAVYEPKECLFAIRIGHSTFPLMELSYLGTLKSWIYRPIFRVLGTGVFATRVPMLLAGVASIWIFFLLLRRIAGTRAAVLGSSLLALDATYLLTICFDWGPVALQHLLLLGGALLLLRFYQEGGEAWLLGGFFLWGLAMWDKALAIWMLSGIAVAAITIFPRQILRVITFRRVIACSLAFGLGAFPLTIYEAKSKFLTFRENVARDPGQISAKARYLVNTALGKGLFDWMVDEDWQTPAPHQPASLLERVSKQVSEKTGHPRQSLMAYAFVIAVLLAAFARGWELRVVLFALIAIGVAWLQMALVANAGGSVHHVVLLWPLPQLAIAVSLSAAARHLGRAAAPALAVVLATLAASNLLLLNEYFALVTRNGGAFEWTDAIFPLSNYLKSMPSSNIFCVDWGMQNGLLLLNRGKMALHAGSDPIAKPNLTGDDRAYLATMISGPDHVFVAHTEGNEVFQGVNGKLVKFAGEMGYEQETMAIIPDSYGRPIFQVYRFAGKAVLARAQP
jgi:Dolichyl-phosphate-mannose-protein mannosyltransferase